MSGESVEASGDRSVAAGGNIRQVATGDFATLAEHATMLPPEAFALGPCTFPVRNVPDRSAQFVGRGRELALLDGAFGEPGGVVVHAVHGLGGIGKSTLAAHWAIGRAVDFNPVWWITAESRTGVDAGLAALGRALQPALVDVLSEDAFRERTLQWLSANDGWLLVLDNVSDPADIRHLLARAPGGRFLITTRRGATSWRGIAEPLDLDVLEPAEAVELFTKVCPGQSGGVEELCRELGYLPLAVDQAAAYCREAGIGPRKYLTLLASYPADMYAATAEGGDAERTVARVWNVTLTRLADTPAAQMILEATGWWAPDGIPRTYLEFLGSPPEITEAIRRLAAHSMITLRGNTISVHRLVQAVARTPERAGPRPDPRRVEVGREIAVRLLLELETATDEDGEWEDAHRVWAAHVEALASRTAPETDTAEMAELYGEAASQYARDGHFERGLALGKRAVTAALLVWGPDHEKVRLARSRLAVGYQGVERFDLALVLYEQILADTERALGADHPKVFQTRGLLADVLEKTGDGERALTLARENAEAAARALGDDHPGTHNARLLLHRLRRELGSEQGGEASVRSLESQLADAITTLGKGHPTVVHLRMELFYTRREAGDFDEAALLIEEAVAGFGMIYGRSHVMTLVARAIHVMLLRSAGEGAQADALAPAVLEDTMQALGDSAYARKMRGWLYLGSPARPD
ncbi:tetratricopeptide repeat protein [Streptomyces sp. NBC_00554]|uniref:tetratricopeptide repeat protein n=1 Tax=Streptomyces sp. NBC_00554 TaxID=2903661 RepID=UPI00352C43A6|nr:tetratricopeptide repeat protein [Streptomyces sp. NBC_00554]